MIEALKTATLCNLSPLEFWELTPFEFNCVVNGYTEREKQREEQLVTIAYVQALWTAQWALGKTKPKPLEAILGNRPKKQMTDEDMLNAIKKINAELGGGTY